MKPRSPAWWPNAAGRGTARFRWMAARCLARLDEALAALDQPTMDGINTYFVSWAAREVGLKVALSGLGGDELFAGYRTFADTPKLERLVRLAWFAPAPLRRAIAPILRALFARQSGSDAARKAMDAWLLPDALPHPYFFARALFPVSDLPRLTEPSLSPEHRERGRRNPRADLARLAPARRGHRAQAGAHRRRVMARNALVHGEHPFARYRFRQHGAIARGSRAAAGYAARGIRRIAARREPGNGPESRRRSSWKRLSGILPAEILPQRKRTFTLPWEEWLRGPLRARLERSFGDPAPAFAAHMHADGVRSVWNAFLAEKTSWSRPWALYVLNEWCRRHL